jgi:hypothetical protein
MKVVSLKAQEEILVAVEGTPPHLYLLTNGPPLGFLLVLEFEKKGSSQVHKAKTFESQTDPSES